MAGWVVCTAEQIVCTDVEGISKGNDYGNGRNDLAIFIVLEISLGHASSGRRLLLCHFEFSAKSL